MANFNFLPEGITPLPSTSDSSSGLTSYWTSEQNKHSRYDHQSKKRQIHDTSLESQPGFKTMILEILNIMRERKTLSKDDLNSIKGLLDNCYMDDPISTFTDDFGYDIVQRAAFVGAVSILEYLVTNGYSLFLNTRKCSSPLYLACLNNNVETVKFLLEQGASITHSCKQCYPKRHNMKVGRKNRRRGSIDGNIVCALPSSRGSTSSNDNNDTTPLFTVVRQNQAMLLELLLESPGNKGQVDPGNLLQYACQKGSMDCFSILMKLYLDVHKTYNSPYSHYPLLHQAFMHSEVCGVRFLDEAFQLNIEKDVVKEADEVNKVNILHFIYYLPHIVKYLDITKRIVQAGYNITNIDRPNTIGESPLHVLVSHVGPKLKSRSFQSESNATPRSASIDVESLENERQTQLFATVQYLISLGANINLVTDLDESVLHKLIDNVSYHSFGSYVDFGLTVGLKVQPKVNQILEYLLRKGANVNYSHPNVPTVLSKLINTLSMFTPNRLDMIWAHIWYTFNLLFKYGADPSILDNRGISNLSMVLTTLHRWLQTISSQQRDNIGDGDSDLPCRALEKIKDLLWLMFEHGLRPTSSVLELAMKQIAIMSNGIKEEDYLEMLKNLLVPFFSYGIDPNMLHVIHEGNNNHRVPSRLHAQFYITRAFIIHHDENDSIMRFFQIFMNTLEQEKLNTLLNGIQATLRYDFEHSVTEQGGCLKQVQGFQRTVRPLKCLARISVAKALRWELTTKTPFLPLPKLIQRFICDL